MVVKVWIVDAKEHTAMQTHPNSGALSNGNKWTKFMIIPVFDLNFLS